LLDPVRLLTLVPRSIGFTAADSYDLLNAQLLEASKQDKFIINFSQFYMMLLRMTQIVYGELFERDSTLAFNKILQVRYCAAVLSFFVRKLVPPMWLWFLLIEVCVPSVQYPAVAVAPVPTVVAAPAAL
jgi:hypothetical protein